MEPAGIQDEGDAAPRGAAREPRTVTIRWSLIRNLVLLILFLTGSSLLTTVFTARRITDTMARALIGSALDRTEADLEGFFRPIRMDLELARELFRDGLLDVDDPVGLRRFFQPLIEAVPQISGVNIGDASGRSYLLARLPDRWRTRTTWIDRWGPRIEYAEWQDEGDPTREWVVEEPPREERYDPRARDWYRVAHEAAEQHEPRARTPGRVYWTRAYTFFTTREPGITAMVHVRDAQGRRFVLAFDVLLRDLSRFTRGLRVGEDGFVVVLDDERLVWGLPGLPRFDEAEAREAAYLKRAAELGVPTLTDGARAFAELGPDPPDTFSFVSGGEVYWADSRPFRLGANREAFAVVAVPERDLVGPIREQRLFLLAVSLLGFAAAVAMAFWLARRYSVPLSTLARNSQRIGGLDLRSFDPVRSSLREVDQLAVEQERMRVALDSFSRYVPVQIIRDLLARGEAAQIGGSRRTLTALFTDVRGFTGISERLSPEALTAHMGEYFEELLRIVQEEGGGTVTQLTGDGIVALWGAPSPDEAHAGHAAEAVLRCGERLEELNRGWVREGRPPLPTRFGLATGPAVVGNVGALSRLVYTALGDTVNLASRLEGLSRHYGTSVLASAETREAAGDAFVWRWVDVVRVKGKARPSAVYELLGRAGQVDAERIARVSRYEAALAAFRERRFDDAVSELEALARDQADDGATRRLLGLARAYAAAPPRGDWDGVSDFFEK